MTYFGLKDVFFVKKIANRKKCAKPQVTLIQVERLDFGRFTQIIPLRGNDKYRLEGYYQFGKLE
jgi:hypothetical protein